MNQDSIFFDDKLGLYVVCDGLGGRRRGEVAADLATNVIRQYVESSQDPKDVTWPYGYNLAMSFAANRIVTSAKLANRQVWRRSEESVEFLGMGTTICAVLLDESSAAIVNIGDSRAYLFRDSRLDQLSVDDTAVGAYMATRQIPLQAPSLSSLRSVLTRAAGSQESVEVHLKECALRPEDRLVLSSDGLHGCVSDDQIVSALAQNPNPGDSTSALLAAAKLAGAPDNVSVIVVHCST